MNSLFKSFWLFPLVVIIVGDEARYYKKIKYHCEINKGYNLGSNHIAVIGQECVATVISLWKRFYLNSALSSMKQTIYSKVHLAL